MAAKDERSALGGFEKKIAPFKWRKNSIQETRRMRNERKKRKRLEKRISAAITEAKVKFECLIQKEKAQKERFLFLARKYYLKWKAVKKPLQHLQAKANPPNAVGSRFLNGARLLSISMDSGNNHTGVTEIPRNQLVVPRDKTGSHSKECLGKGTFGQCLKMYYKGIPVAVKEFNNLSTAQDVRQEALVMSKCSHPSLPHLFGIDLIEKPYLLVSYFYGINDISCTLHCALHSTSMSLTYFSAAKIMLKLCQAVEHLHTKQYLHRDIKSDNIVLTKVNSDYHPMLIDFGKAISVHEAHLERKDLTLHEKAEYQRKHRHIAPEIVEGQNPSYHSDIYSVGVLMADVSDKIQTERTFVNLQLKCLKEDPKFRCPISHLLDVLNCIVKGSEGKTQHIHVGNI